MSLDQLPEFLLTHYEVYEWKHAVAVLKMDFSKEYEDIVDVLTQFRLHEIDIVKKGGNKSRVAAAIDGAFYTRGWAEKAFETKVVVDQTEHDSPTHSIDCFRNGIGVEIEWNNKDPFFDRDLNNFRLLFDLRVLSVGVIITRSDELRTLFANLDTQLGFDKRIEDWKRKGKNRGSRPTGLADKYGESTTHMGKLMPRIDGGGGGGCPVLVFGIKRDLYVPGQKVTVADVDIVQSDEAGEDETEAGEP